MQQQISGDKNPYLSQYRNDISAKQREIRQRLGYDTSSKTSSQQETKPKERSRLNDDNETIPSIDDDDEKTVEQVSREKYYKSRFSYFDDEAEASLQFFKKNLLPSSQIKSSPATGSLFDRQSTASSNLRLDSSPQVISATIERPRPLSERYESSSSRTLQKFSKEPASTVKPVPFKQTSLNEPKITRLSTLERNNPATGPANGLEQKQNYQKLQQQQQQGLTTSSKVPSFEKPPNEVVKNLKSSNEDRQRSQSNRARSSERPPTSSSFVSQTDQGHDNRTETKSIHSNDGRRSAESPNTNSPFSRRPMYNSLLRAHDSIRLKVNRPKVRPKSTNLVDDAELDDAIPLPSIDPNTIPNERAIDVKRSSSRRKNKKKDGVEGKAESSKEELPVRNFRDVRIVKVVLTETERSIGVTVRAEDGNIVVARIMAGSLADKQGALQVGDIILSVNDCEVYTPEQLQEQLRKPTVDDTVIMKIVPSFREELPTLCIYLRALFNYDANEDSLLPCKEVGVSFKQGDILEVVNQEDPNWWQARRVDSTNLQTGLIPSQELEERRRAFVIPDYDLATRTSICGTKVSRKSKKKEIYNVGQNSDFDKAELQLYEEVCRTPAFERRTLVLIGANGVGKQAFKARLITMDPERFGTPLPHTSRLPREGEEDGVHYHFVTRERMEEDIIDGRYLEYGEYDGALYGTKLDSVREIIGSGKVCVLDCSATCLKVLKTSDYLPFVAFIAAPTLDQLRYMHEWARNGNRNYTTLDRALSRQSRRAKTLQDFAFDFFEDEDLQLTVEESARLFRVYENYFDIVLVNDNFESTFDILRRAIDDLSMAPQWIPISWIYGT